MINGDVWFNSTNAELFVWYDDGQPPDSSRSKQWVQAIGGAGPQGPPGEPGISSYNFIEPITQNGNDVSLTSTFYKNSLIMALTTTDLFYVQRPSGPDAGNYKMQAGELIDFIASTPAVQYRGSVDCTLAVGAQLDPNPPIIGDLYINTGTGNVDGSGADSTNAWVGIQGDPIAEGQRIIFDGTSWEILGQAAGGGVQTITGTAPITVGGDADDVIIGIDEATNAAFGSTRLAQDPPNGGNLTSTAATDVLSVPHFNELAGRIQTAAGGGIQSVTGENGVTASGTTDVTVSGVMQRLL